MMQGSAARDFPTVRCDFSNGCLFREAMNVERFTARTRIPYPRSKYALGGTPKARLKAVPNPPTER